MGMRVAPIAILTLLSLTARAQPAAPPTGTFSAPSPTTLQIDDPMLTPIPGPTHALSSWAQAMAMVRARSTDLRLAIDEVRRAEALSREALAGALPILTATGTATRNMIRSEIQSFDFRTLTIS